MDNIFGSHSRLKPSVTKEIDMLSLPNDVIINILASLSASSHSDILRAKTICKAFNELGNHDFVYQTMSLKDVETVPWHKNNQRTLLMERCIECDNSEALYMQGVVDYFSNRNSKFGLEYLHKSAKLGQLKALYVYGIISLFGDEESKEKGIEILNENVLKGELWKCRNELIVILKQLWMGIPENIDRVVVCCSVHSHNQKMWKFTWPVMDGDENLECRACKCDRELDFLMSHFRIYR